MVQKDACTKSEYKLFHCIPTATFNKTYRQQNKPLELLTWEKKTLYTIAIKPIISKPFSNFNLCITFAGTQSSFCAPDLKWDYFIA